MQAAATQDDRITETENHSDPRISPADRLKRQLEDYRKMVDSLEKELEADRKSFFSRLRRWAAVR